MESDDRAFLAKAVKKAIDGMEKGGGPFGAIIVRKGEIIAEAYNKVVKDHDPTAHAEILAIRQAAETLKTHDLSDCILYTSCEPCPMCLGAIYWSGIKKVVYACDRHDASDAGFNDGFIYNEIMLDPSERQISFIRMNGPENCDVFRKWDTLENKIPY